MVEGRDGTSESKMARRFCSGWAAIDWPLMLRRSEQRILHTVVAHEAVLLRVVQALPPNLQTARASHGTDDAASHIRIKQTPRSLAFPETYDVFTCGTAVLAVAHELANNQQSPLRSACFLSRPLHRT